MEAVWNFIRENWNYLSLAILFVLDLLLLLKRSNYKLVDNSLYYHIVQWTKQAENLFADGPTKLQYVLARIKDLLPDDFDKFKEFYIAAIEEVLSSPEKKGLKNEKI